jgi:F-type H+-transporting ATPase subunit delta
MAELATIARPYAEALYQVAVKHDVKAWGAALDALALVAQDADLRQFADNPKVTSEQVYAVMTAAAKQDLAPELQNFLRAVIENSRLAALPEVVAQFHVLANAAAGVADAQIFSAYPIDAAQLSDVMAPWRSVSVASSKPMSRWSLHSSAVSVWWSATRCSTPPSRPAWNA